MVTHARRVIATIEARMGSTRLPEKMVKEIYPGLTALGAVIERLKRAKTINEIVLATTTGESENALENIAHRYSIRSFRGSEEDVLGRVISAGKIARADMLVLVTGDGTCVSPTVIDEAVRFFLSHHYDLVSNCVFEDSYPIGIDAQVVSMDALERAYTMARKAPYISDKNNFEHTNFFIKHHPDLFRIHQYSAPAKYQHPELAFVLDTTADLEVMRGIYTKLYPQNPAFDLDDILKLIAREPEISKPLDGLAVNRLGY